MTALPSGPRRSWRPGDRLGLLVRDVRRRLAAWREAWHQWRLVRRHRATLRTEVREEHRRRRGRRWDFRIAVLFASWAAITAGVAELTDAPAVVWPVSAGLVGLGVVGVRTLWFLLLYGDRTLDTATRRELEELRGSKERR